LAAPDAAAAFDRDRDSDARDAAMARGARAGRAA
jgi:hypothetical protein